MNPTINSESVKHRWAWPAVSLLLVLFLIAGISLYRASTRESTNPAASPTDVPERVVAKDRAPATHAGASSHLSASPDALIAANQRAESEQRAKIEQAQQGLAARYRSEPRDATWAAAKERDLLTLTRLEQAGRMNAMPSSVDVDCKTSSCRIAADFTSQTSANDWLTVFTTSLGDSLPFGTTEQKTNPDGSVTIEIFGASH